MAATIQDLMHRLRSTEPTSPRLTWYGPGGERVELSGRVLDNWVAKTANFLCEELDVEPGSVVALDLPAHWRAVCWTLAGWQCGATVRLGGGTGPADVVATADPAAYVAGAGAGTTVVAVALGALDLRWRTELPPGVVDYAGEVRSFADVFFPDQLPDAALPAVQGGISYGELFTGFAAPSGPNRTLVPAGELASTVALCLGVWAAGGSVVLVHPDVTADAKLRQTERVTAP